MRRPIECTFNGRTLTVELVTVQKDSQEFFVEGEVRPNRPRDQIWKAVCMSGLLARYQVSEIEIIDKGLFWLVIYRRLPGAGIEQFTIEGSQ